MAKPKESKAKTKTLYVPLELNAAKLLEELADREHRSTGQQAALILVKFLIGEGASA